MALRMKAMTGDKSADAFCEMWDRFERIIGCAEGDALCAYRQEAWSCSMVVVMVGASAVVFYISTTLWCHH